VTHNRLLHKKSRYYFSISFLDGGTIFGECTQIEIYVSSDYPIFFLVYLGVWVNTATNFERCHVEISLPELYSIVTHEQAVSALVIETGVSEPSWYHGSLTQSHSAELCFPQLS